VSGSAAISTEGFLHMAVKLNTARLIKLGYTQSISKASISWKDITEQMLN
jgi:hypothetical protein